MSRSIVDSGLVEADCGVDAALLEGVERRHTAAQSEIRAAIVADMGAGRGDAVEIGLAEPHPVAQGQPWPEKTEAVDVVEGGAAAAAARIFFLVSGLDEMHVHRRLVARQVIGEHFESLVRAPVEVGRRQLDLDPLLVVVRGMEMLEQRAVIGQTQPKAGEMPLQCRLQLGRQARGEFLVVLIDEPVLVAQCEGTGDAHADVFIGADHLAGPGFDRLQPARKPAVQMLHGGDAGGDHLKG